MAVVKNNRPNITTVRGSRGQAVRLLPGVNEVDDETWDEIWKANPMAASLVSAGNITVVERAPRTARERAAAVSDIFDVERLTELLEDRSKQVRDAAEAQLAKINGMADESDD